MIYLLISHSLERSIVSTAVRLSQVHSETSCEKTTHSRHKAIRALVNLIICVYFSNGRHRTTSSRVLPLSPQMHTFHAVHWCWLLLFFETLLSLSPCRTVIASLTSLPSQLKCDRRANEKEEEWVKWCVTLDAAHGLTHTQYKVTGVTRVCKSEAHRHYRYRMKKYEWRMSQHVNRTDTHYIYPLQ